MPVVGGWGWAFLALIGLVLPILSHQTARIVEDPSARPPRRAVYLESVLWLGLLGLFALFVAGRERIALSSPGRPVAADWGLGLLALAVLLAAGILRWRFAGRADRERLAWIVPRDRGDLPGWLAVSLAAGFGEELVYRGVLFSLLLALVGSTAPAALLAAAAFAAGHAYQGRVGVAIVFLFGLVFQGIALATGGLAVPIAVHALYDLAAGLLYGALAERAGLHTPEPTGPADPPREISEESPNSSP